MATWFAAGMLSVATLGAATPANAAEVTVVVVAPSALTPTKARAIHRLEAELNAAGFVVLPSEVHPPQNQGDELGCGTVPAFSFVEDGLELWALLCIYDHTTGNPTVWRVGIRSDERPDAEAALAIRAVEVLRAHVVSGDSLQPLATHPPRASTSANAAPTGPRASLLAGAFGELGIGAWRGWPGLGPTVSPVVRIGYGNANGVAGRLTFAGLGSSAKLQSVAGSAEVKEQAVVVELVRAFLVARSVQPHIAIGAGIYHADIVGTAPVGYEALRGSMVALLTEAEAGVAVRCTDRLALTAGFSGLINFPGLKIRLGNEQVGGTGRPLLLATMGLSVSYGP